MTKRVCIVGSLNADSVVRVGRFPQAGETLIGKDHALYPGGKGGNQAFGVGRLLGGQTDVEVAMFGQVGGDSHGPWLKDNLASAGVDVAGVAVDANTSSGIAVIAINEQGQNNIIIVPGANGTFTPDKLIQHEEALGHSQVVLLQLEIPMATVMRAAMIARQGGATVILDPAPAAALPDELLQFCDFVTPNENELRTLLGDKVSDQELDRDAARAGGKTLIARGARNAIIKMGAAGALWVGPEGEHFWPAHKVQAVDTTAAGDAWNAGFAAALAQGQSVIAAGKQACATAALAVTKAGAQPSMPTQGEVDEMLSRPA